MLSNRGRLLAELIEWLADHGVEPAGPLSCPLVVDLSLSDLRDIEVGVTAATDLSDPTSRYETMKYVLVC